MRRRLRELGYSVGRFPTGELNALVDVPDVRVGHRTLVEGDRLRTGVTAILPHGGQPLRGQGARRLSRRERVRQGDRSDTAGRARHHREPAPAHEHPLCRTCVGGRAAAPARPESRSGARPRHGERDRRRVLRRLALRRSRARRARRARAGGDRSRGARRYERGRGRRRHGHDLLRLQVGGRDLIAERRRPRARLPRCVQLRRETGPADAGRPGRGAARGGRGAAR